jgi:hypothetical protein
LSQWSLIALKPVIDSERRLCNTNSPLKDRIEILVSLGNIQCNKILLEPLSQVLSLYSRRRHRSSAIKYLIPQQAGSNFTNPTFENGLRRGEEEGANSACAVLISFVDVDRQNETSIQRKAASDIIEKDYLPYFVQLSLGNLPIVLLKFLARYRAILTKCRRPIGLTSNK